MKIRTLNWLNKNIKNNYLNKVVFITGGHSGIGFAASKICAHLNMNIIWGSRNIDKANESKTKLLKEYPNAKIDIITLDLANINSINKCCDELKKYKIDYLYNNAGVYRIPKSYTAHGIDLTIGTNFIGTYYLTKLIAEYYISIKQPLNIIFTTSLMANFHSINYKDFFLENRYGKIKSYCVSKRMVYHAYEYFKQLNPEYIKCMIIHPGSSYTPLINKGYKNKIISTLAKPVMKTLFHSPECAALTFFKAIENNDEKLVCPRGIFHISGLPKSKSVTKNMTKNYSYSIVVAENTINTITKTL